MTPYDLTNADRAKILVEALPYIRKYTNKVVVVKYGGNAMTSGGLKADVMGDVVLLTLVGVKVVLVHGGGPEITEMLGRTGKKSEFVDGLRVTDRETVDIVQMVLAGKVNKDLVNLLETKGGRAIGLSGIDGRMISARMKDPRLGYVGEITRVNPAPVWDMLDRGYIPVISTVGCDEEGNSYTINADTAAAMIAGAIKAEAFFTLTDIRGILRDRDDPGSLIRTVRADETESLIESGVISGGMIPKIRSCTDAINAGVKRVFVIDGRIPHAILIEMLTDEGIGTMFTKGE